MDEVAAAIDALEAQGEAGMSEYAVRQERWSTEYYYHLGWVEALLALRQRLGLPEKGQTP